MVQRALNLVEESQPAPVIAAPPCPPLTDAQFRMFLDPIGQVVQDRDLRKVIYFGGIEPSLRYIILFWTSLMSYFALISLQISKTFVLQESGLEAYSECVP